MREGGNYISVPAYRVPAITNVLATPLIPSAKAPGWFQYLNPMGPGPIPPVLMITARRKKMQMEMTLMLWSVSVDFRGRKRTYRDSQNSTSP